MPTILVMEPDNHARELITYNLTASGFGVVVTHSTTFTDPSGDGTVAAAIIDYNQPGALNLCSTLSAIMLVSSEDEMIECFDAGAADCMIKPFSVRELMARVRALLRRPTRHSNAGTQDCEKQPLVVGSLILYPERFEAHLDGANIHTTAREFEILLTLAEHAGHAVSREDLIKRIWGEDFVGETHTIDVHVRRLRKKLGADMIESVYGIGFMLIPGQRVGAIPTDPEAIPAAKSGV